MEGHVNAWWAPAAYDSWDEQSADIWTANAEDLPNIDDLLVVTRPDDNTRWINTEGYFNWRAPAEPDREAGDSERREIWYLATGYLVRSDEASPFLEWAKSQDFWGRWMPRPPGLHELYLGEHAWAPASRYFQKPYYGDDGWVEPRNGCPATVRVTALEKNQEGNDFDCSVDDSYTLRLPAPDLMSHLGISWAGPGADCVDSSETLIAYDPTAHEPGPDALLFREDRFQQYLDEQGLTVCWTVIGEKRVLPPTFSPRSDYRSLRISGAFALISGQIEGFTTHKNLSDEDGDEDH